MTARLHRDKLDLAQIQPQQTREGVTVTSGSGHEYILPLATLKERSQLIQDYIKDWDIEPEIVPARPLTDRELGAYAKHLTDSEDSSETDVESIYVAADFFGDTTTISELATLGLEYGPRLSKLAEATDDQVLVTALAKLAPIPSSEFNILANVLSRDKSLFMSGTGLVASVELQTSKAEILSLNPEFGDIYTEPFRGTELRTTGPALAPHVLYAFGANSGPLYLTWDRTNFHRPVRSDEVAKDKSYIGLGHPVLGPKIVKQGRLAFLRGDGSYFTVTQEADPNIIVDRADHWSCVVESKPSSIPTRPAPRQSLFSQRLQAKTKSESSPSSSLGRSSRPAVRTLTLKKAAQTLRLEQISSAVETKTVTVDFVLIAIVKSWLVGLTEDRLKFQHIETGQVLEYKRPGWLQDSSMVVGSISGLSIRTDHGAVYVSLHAWLEQPSRYVPCYSVNSMNSLLRHCLKPERPELMPTLWLELI